MQMNISIQITHWGEAKSQVMPIRHEIFIKEQKVPEELEWDEFDQGALHAIVKKDDEVIGTARLIIDNTIARIGRMAIKKEFRGQGIGQEMLEALVTKSLELDVSLIKLHAQVHAVSFYAKLGFVTHGEIFSEAGIDHVNMQKVLQ
jgi:predicted GNAT family N-acyltransferase